MRTRVCGEVTDYVSGATLNHSLPQISGDAAFQQVPKEALQQRMKIEGLDPSVLE